MAHPYQQHRGRYPHETKRVEKLYGKFARGGKVKGGKGHHTKINIVVAPKAGGADVPPPPMAPPPGAGMTPPPMPPKTPMMPPPGGPMGGGMPGIGAKPGGMKRGGGVPSGISSPENLKKWADYASKNTKYERGGRVYPLDAATGGAGGAGGRLAKAHLRGKRGR